MKTVSWRSISDINVEGYTRETGHPTHRVRSVCGAADRFAAGAETIFRRAEGAVWMVLYGLAPFFISTLIPAKNAKIACFLYDCA